MEVERITDAVGRMHSSGRSKAVVQWRYLQLIPSLVVKVMANVLVMVDCYRCHEVAREICDA